MNLLIAVKSDIITELLVSSLSQYDIHTCNTGTDALAMLETLQPEILLLDLSLPVMDGLTLLRKSRYKPKYILALTNLATQAVRQAAADAGVQDMILIPCTVGHIVAHLEQLTKRIPSPDL